MQRSTKRTTRVLTRRAVLTAAALTATLVLAACGGDGDDGGSAAAPSASPSASATVSAGAHNARDVTFAQGMIPHHRQALEMAGLAASRASSAQVKDLAARIEKAQDPEIRSMSGWLETWGETVPEDSDDPATSMPGMDHSAHSGGTMAGMMDATDMDRLEKASGADFDSMFLTMMIEHHEGAVEMAGTEKAEGAYGPAKAMAGDIVTGQTAEIEEMKKLLAQ